MTYHPADEAKLFVQSVMQRLVQSVASGRAVYVEKHAGIPHGKSLGLNS